MTALQDAGRIRAMVARLLESGPYADPGRRGASIADPLLVETPGGDPHSWFVGLTDGDRLIGVFQLLLDGTPMRYSSFERRPGDRSRCPLARDWLDPAAAAGRATRSRGGEVVGTPRLTFDRNPDRVVWSTALRSTDGHVRTVFVAGETVYEPPASGTVG
jgi:hypothetical protein